MNKYLFKGRIVGEIYKDMISHNPILLFLDYDGTLAPFRENPSQAVPFPGIKEILKKLQNIQQIKLSLITGRSLTSLHHLIYLENVYYAGQHGLEIINDRGENLNQKIKDFNKINNIYSEIMDYLNHEFNKNHLLKIENKDPVLTIHLPEITDSKNQDNHDKYMSETELKNLKNYLQSRIKNSSLEIMEGRQIVEIKPKNWHKGKAVQIIQQQILKRNSSPNPLLIYIGDDTTDEDAFKTLQNLEQKSLSIYVKNEDSRESNAQYYLNNPLEVLRFLEGIHKTLT